MRKFKYIFILLISYFAIVSLSSCTIVKDYSYNLITPDYILMGDDSLEGFYLTSDNNEKITLTSSMLTSNSEFSFYKEGTQLFQFSYQNNIYEKNIDVRRRKFENISFLDKVFQYNGEEISIEVTGDLGNATIWYPYGNSFTKVGEYEVTAIISLLYYETLELKATLIIVE